MAEFKTKFNIGDKVQINSHDYKEKTNIIKGIYVATDGSICYQLDNINALIYENSLEFARPKLIGWEPTYAVDKWLSLNDIDNISAENEQIKNKTIIKDVILEQLILHNVKKFKKRLISHIKDELECIHNDNLLNGKPSLRREYEDLLSSMEILKDMPIEDFNNLSMQKIREIINNNNIIVDSVFLDSMNK